jgi:hypothetical protein
MPARRTPVINTTAPVNVPDSVYDKELEKRTLADLRDGDLVPVFIVPITGKPGEVRVFHINSVPVPVRVGKVVKVKPIVAELIYNQARAGKLSIVSTKDYDASGLKKGYYMGDRS